MHMRLNDSFWKPAMEESSFDILTAETHFARNAARSHCTDAAGPAKRLAIADYSDGLCCLVGCLSRGIAGWRTAIVNNECHADSEGSQEPLKAARVSGWPALLERMVLYGGPCHTQL